MHRARRAAPRRAARRRRPRALSLQLRGVVRARPDYRETHRATSERRSGGTSIKSRKPLIGVDVHARFRVESVRHVSSSEGRKGEGGRERERGRVSSCFSRRARGDPDPRVRRCLECVREWFFSIFFSARCHGIESVYDLKRGGIHGEMCVNNE